MTAKQTPSYTEALEAVRTLIAYIGDNPERDGLLDTPQRVLNAWYNSWGYGYRKQAPHMKLFCEPGLKIDQMVFQGNITFSSFCEHHMAPFFGVAHIAYIPSPKGVVGLSKLARALDFFASRLQVQERLTTQLATFLEHTVSPDVAVRLEATHMCMVTRGVHQHNAKTVTSDLRGEFYANGDTRAEFLAQVV